LLDSAGEGRPSKFHHHVDGGPWDREFDGDMDVPVSTTVDELVGAYRAAWTHSNEIIRRVGDPSALTALPVHGQRLPLFALGHGPHDRRDRWARWPRRHPSRAARRSDRPVSPQAVGEIWGWPVRADSADTDGELLGAADRVNRSCRGSSDRADHR